MVPEEREKTPRKDELRRQMSDDVSHCLVVGADGDLPSRDKQDHRLVTVRAEYRSWCMLCVTEDKGQNVNDHGREVLDGSLDSHLLRVVQGCSTAMLDC